MIDEALGIVRCARCGHRLEGEIECPFYSLFAESSKRDALPKWVFITASFLTSPLSIYFVIKGGRLSLGEKILVSSGCLFWFGIYMWL